MEKTNSLLSSYKLFSNFQNCKSLQTPHH